MLFFLACHHDEIPTQPDAVVTTETDHGTPEGHTFSTYEGEVNWKWGYSADASDLDCDMWWTAVGTPIDPCPDCVWTFQVDMTLDRAKSYYSEDCLGELAGTELSWQLGLVENFYGYDTPLLLLYEDSYYHYWLPGFVSTWVYPQVSWGGGFLYLPVEQDGQTFSYTNYWYGMATVQ